MAGRLQSDLHLVGSMPFDTVEEAFRAAAHALDGSVAALPDGEIGDRRNWVRYLPMNVYSRLACLEETSRPDEDRLPGPGESGTYSRWPGMWTFRIKSGEQLRFDDLHYGRYAVDSYRIFRTLRDTGLITPGVRFQVSLPGSGSAVEPFFDDVTQWPDAHKAYQAGIRREIESMLESIPADDLSIQFDLAWEVVDLASGDDSFFPFWPKQSVEQKLERHAATLDELWRGVPDDIWFGYHWCYGTRGGWPMTAMTDLSICVALSNEAIRRAGRRVDFVHMPVVRHPDDAFFAPLEDLDIGDARLYLGLIHHTDSVHSFRERFRLAREHYDAFGIASVCGYGRLSPDELDRALAAHRDCAAAMRAERKAGRTNRRLA